MTVEGVSGNLELCFVSDHVRAVDGSTGYPAYNLETCPEDRDDFNDSVESQFSSLV